MHSRGQRVLPKMNVEENLLRGAYQEPSAAKTQNRLARVYEIFPRLRERRAQFAGTMSDREQGMISIKRNLMNEIAC